MREETLPVNTRDFDALTRRYFTATNRRVVFAGLGGLLAFLIGFLDQPGVFAQNKGRRRRCRAVGQRCAKGRRPGCCGKATCRRGRCRCGKNQKACHGRCIGKKRRCNCPAGQTQCGHRCANLNSAKGHCGSCGNACAGTATCQNGVCVSGGAYRRVREVQGQDGSHTLRPYAIAQDRAGSLYVTDDPEGTPTGPGTVWKFTRNGVLNDIWTHVGTLPVAIGFNPDDLAYVVDIVDNTILTFSRFGQQQSLTINVPGGPNALAVGPNGDIYVAIASEADPTAKIRQYDSTGSFIDNWGGSAHDGFDIPEGIATAPNGDVYIVDAGTKLVSHWSPDGDFNAEWAGPGSGFGLPGAIAVDAAGFVYVVDATPGVIVKFTATGGYVGTFGQDADFASAEYIVVTKTGTVWVTDLTGERIIQFDPA